jgi:hypothetical protein
MMTDAEDRDPFERRISSLMDAAAQDLVPGPSIPSRLKRRARVQQTAVIVGGLATVLLLAVFAGAAVRALLPGPDSVRPASNDQRGSGGTYPCTVEPQPHQPKHGTMCVATGTYGDADWTLVTYKDEKHGMCIDLEVTTPDGGGGGGGCGYEDDRGIGIGLSSGDEYPEGIAYGPVTPSVDRLVLERENGEELELELYPTPGSAPPNAPRFYLVFLPDDAAALVAYDDTGQEVDRRDSELDPAPPVPESTQLGPPVQVASGTYEGLAWDLQAYEERMGDDVRPCTELHLGKGDERFGGGGGCYLLPDQVIGYAESAYGEKYPSLISIAGAVRPEVDEITLELADGSSIPLAIYRMSVDGDANEPFDVDFFVGFVDVGKRGTLEGHVVARAANGDVLERHGLCPDFRAGSDSTCGGG